MLRLEAGNGELILAPAIGGGIAALRFGGRDALRPASAESLANGNPLGLAEFPMAPFINRLAGNAFEWQGQPIVLAPAHANTGEALHGTAWRVPWHVLDARSDWALLEAQWAPAPAWPFAFTVQRQFTLSENALRVDVALTAGPDAPMPAALGFHAYFPAAGAMLQAASQAAWLTDCRGIPTSLEEIEAAALVRAGLAASDHALDHCFTGWDGVVHAQWPSHAVILRAEPNPGFLQIYTPKGADYFCAEPQTAMPDAFNRPSELSGTRCLAPGESLRLRIDLQFISAYS